MVAQHINYITNKFSLNSNSNFKSHSSEHNASLQQLPQIICEAYIVGERKGKSERESLFMYFGGGGGETIVDVM